jgi:hypothetical protein
MESPVRFNEEVDDLVVLMRTMGSPENQAAIEAGGVIVESAGAFTLAIGPALTRMGLSSLFRFPVGRHRQDCRSAPLSRGNAMEFPYKIMPIVIKYCV